MTTQIAQLVSLQEIDQRLQRKEQQLEDLHQQIATIRSEKELRQREAEERQQRISELESQQRETDGQLKLEEEKIKEKRVRLNRVRNERELLVTPARNRVDERGEWPDRRKYSECDGATRRGAANNSPISKRVSKSSTRSSLRRRPRQKHKSRPWKRRRRPTAGNGNNSWRTWTRIYVRAMSVSSAIVEPWRLWKSATEPARVAICVFRLICVIRFRVARCRAAAISFIARIPIVDGLCTYRSRQTGRPTPNRVWEEIKRSRSCTAGARKVRTPWGRVAANDSLP